MFDLTAHYVVTSNHIASSIHNSSLNAFLLIGDFIKVSPTYYPGTTQVYQIIDITALEDKAIAEIGSHDRQHWITRLGNSYNIFIE